ncbi:MAG: flagellar brake protein [Pseudomonadota bacterium]|nr:flagellar brake protein [Pseudomonadota bacterium]
METQPAPLDAMLGTSGLEEFRISSPREIGLLLKQLVDGSILLELHGSDGSVFPSAIWTMDGDRGTICFNADPSDPAMQAVLHFQEAVVVGYIDNVKVQFDVHDLVLLRGSRASVLSCPFPRKMFRFQRRNAFRVRPLARDTPVARLRHPDMPEFEFGLRVIDVSIGGCALFLPHDVPLMNVGVLMTGVCMELDADTRLNVDMRLKYAATISAEARGVRLGLEFVRPGGDALRTLQRFIDLTQKRGKLMALT